MHTQGTQKQEYKKCNTYYTEGISWTHTDKSVMEGTHRNGNGFRDETHTWNTYTGQGHVMAHTEQ